LREAEAAVDLLEPGHDHERRRAEQLQALALNLLGRTREALEILQRLAEESPNDATACFNVAYALDRQQLIRDAKEWYEKALVIEPQNRSASLHLAWLLTTAAQEDLRDLERAERMLLEVLERDVGQSQEVLLMVRDFGFRTGRIDALEAVMTRQIARPGLSKQRRAALEHARNQLRSGAPGTRR
jgi:tetratricopeptide (TPR) repeat protein